VKGIVNVLPFYLFTFLPLSSFAQVGEYRTDFAIGGSVGYSLSSIAFVPTVPQSQLGGMTAGFTARYTCEKYFNSICAIVGEVNYAQIGWKERIWNKNDEPVVMHNDTSQVLRYSRKITYIQVPVLARLGWGRERSGMQFFFQVGPQFGIYLGDKTDSNFDVRDPAFNPGSGQYFNSTYEYGDKRASHIVAQDSMAIENKLDYGIAIGGGLEYSNRHLGHFIIEGRYYYGLGNIYGATKRDYFARSNFGNIVIKFTYLFDLIRTKNDKIK
jgi:hypothetical protein